MTYLPVSLSLSPPPFLSLTHSLSLARSLSLSLSLSLGQYADLESMGWYELLMFYGFKEGEEPQSDDEDLSLIPKLVDKVVIPRLTGQASWLRPL